MKPEIWHRRLWAGLLSLLTLTLTIAACGGGSGGGSGSTSSVVSISINATTTSIVLGQTTTVSVFPVDALGNLLGVSLTWQSSNTTVATVSSDGVVTAVAQGSTQISVSAGGITSNLITITVAAPGSGPPISTALPVVTATDRTTHLDLAASTGSWSNSPTTFSYRWLRNGSAIAGATLATYTTTVADQGTSVAAVVIAMNGVGSTAATSLAVAVPTPPNAGNPTLGAHALVFHISQGSVGATLPLPALSTQSGSTMLAFVGKGSLSEINPPTDSLGNSPYVQLGTKNTFTRWPGEGTALYAFNSIVGGANHVLRVNDQNTFDEVTFAAVEVRNGGVVQDHVWSEVLNSAAQTSLSVTTTGPATLVAVWYGDDASPTASNPVPNNGFTVIEGNGNAVESVQMYVATKNVAAAGTYNVTWNTTPVQGAQLYLIAVQKR